MKKYLQVMFLLLSISAFGQHEVKVMSYNIRYDNEGDGINQWTNRKDTLINLVKKHDPDIIGMQEALNNQFVYLNAHLSDYESFGVGRDNGKDQGEYAPVYSRKKMFEKLDGNYFWLSRTPDIPGSKDWDAALTRMVTWVKLRHKKSGEVIFVFNTHFDHVGKQARRESAILLKEKIKNIAGNDLFILTGDLNTEPAEEAYKTLTDGKIKLFADAGSGSKEGTFCGFNVGSKTCKRIDYILCSKKMKPGSYIVIHDNNGTSYPSDHMPVQARIVF